MAIKHYSTEKASSLRGVVYYKKELPGSSIYKTKAGYLKCNLAEMLSLVNISENLADYYKHNRIVTRPIFRELHWSPARYSAGIHRFLYALNDYNRFVALEKAMIKRALLAKPAFEKICDLLEEASQNAPDLRSFGASIRVGYRNGMPEISISYKNIIVTVDGTAGDVESSKSKRCSYQFPYGNVTLKWSFGEGYRIANLIRGADCINLKANSFDFISSMMVYSQFMLNRAHMYVDGAPDFFKRGWRDRVCFSQHYGDIVLAASNLDFLTMAYRIRQWLEYIDIDRASPHAGPYYFYMGAPKEYGELAKYLGTTYQCETHYRPKKKECAIIKCQLRRTCHIYRSGLYEDEATSGPAPAAGSGSFRLTCEERLSVASAPSSALSIPTDIIAEINVAQPDVPSDERLF